MTTLAGKPITSNGLGLMRMSMPMGAIPDEEAFKVLKTALAQGANVWNGADFYGPPNSNSLHLMNRYFTAYPEDADKVVLCIKSGLASLVTFQLDCSPENMRKSVERCNEILDGKKFIDIFGPARVDPAVPIEETVAALGELVKEGKIGGIQLSEVRAETIHRASKVHRIEMVEAEVSLWSTDIFSNGVAEACHELEIVVSAHSPLAAGCLSGQIKSLDDVPERSPYRHFPRCLEDNFKNNMKLVDALKKFADDKGITIARLAISWVKAQGDLEGRPIIVPIPGARSEKSVIENAQNYPLTDGDLKVIAEILAKYPIIGGRYPDAAAKMAEY